MFSTGDINSGIIWLVLVGLFIAGMVFGGKREEDDQDTQMPFDFTEPDSSSPLLSSENGLKIHPPSSETTALAVGLHFAFDVPDKARDAIRDFLDSLDGFENVDHAHVGYIGRNLAQYSELEVEALKKASRHDYSPREELIAWYAEEFGADKRKDAEKMTNRQLGAIQFRQRFREYVLRQITSEPVQNYYLSYIQEGQKQARLIVVCKTTEDQPLGLEIYDIQEYVADDSQAKQAIGHYYGYLQERWKLTHGSRNITIDDQDTLFEEAYAHYIGRLNRLRGSPVPDDVRTDCYINSIIYPATRDYNALTNLTQAIRIIHLENPRDKEEQIQQAYRTFIDGLKDISSFKRKKLRKDLYHALRIAFDPEWKAKVVQSMVQQMRDDPLTQSLFGNLFKFLSKAAVLTKCLSINQPAIMFAVYRRAAVLSEEEVISEAQSVLQEVYRRMPYLQEEKFIVEQLDPHGMRLTTVDAYQSAIKQVLDTNFTMIANYIGFTKDKPESEQAAIVRKHLYESLILLRLLQIESDHLAQEKDSGNGIQGTLPLYVGFSAPGTEFLILLMLAIAAWYFFANKNTRYKHLLSVALAGVAASLIIYGILTGQTMGGMDVPLIALGLIDPTGKNGKNGDPEEQTPENELNNVASNVMRKVTSHSASGDVREKRWDTMDVPERIAYVEGLLEVHPNNQHYLSLLGGLLANLDPERAEEVLLRSIEIDKTVADPYYYLAIICYNRQDFDTAYDYHEKVQELMKSQRKVDFDMCYAFGECCVIAGYEMGKQEKADKAEKFLKKGISILTQAVEIARKQKNPIGEIKAINQLASAYVQSNKSEEVLRYFHETKALADSLCEQYDSLDEDGQTLIKRYKFLEGLCFLTLEEYQAALQALKRLEDGENNKWIAFVKATMHYENGKYLFAERFADKALEIDETSTIAKVYKFLAQAGRKWQEEDRTGAKDCLAKAVEISVSEKLLLSVSCSIAYIRFALDEGDLTSARKHFQEAVLDMAVAKKKASKVKNVKDLLAIAKKQRKLMMRYPESLRALCALSVELTLLEKQRSAMFDVTLMFLDGLLERSERRALEEDKKRDQIFVYYQHGILQAKEADFTDDLKEKISLLRSAQGFLNQAVQLAPDDQDINRHLRSVQAQIAQITETVGADFDRLILDEVQGELERLLALLNGGKKIFSEIQKEIDKLPVLKETQAIDEAVELLEGLKRKIKNRKFQDYVAAVIGQLNERKTKKQEENREQTVDAQIERAERELAALLPQLYGKDDSAREEIMWLVSDVLATTEGQAKTRTVGHIGALFLALILKDYIEKNHPFYAEVFGHDEQDIQDAIYEAVVKHWDDRGDLPKMLLAVLSVGAACVILNSRYYQKHDILPLTFAQFAVDHPKLSLRDLKNAFDIIQKGSGNLVQFLDDIFRGFIIENNRIPVAPGTPEGDWQYAVAVAKEYYGTRRKLKEVYRLVYGGPGREGNGFDTGLRELRKDVDRIIDALAQNPGFSIRDIKDECWKQLDIQCYNFLYTRTDVLKNTQGLTQEEFSNSFYYCISLWMFEKRALNKILIPAQNVPRLCAMVDEEFGKLIEEGLFTPVTLNTYARKEALIELLEQLGPEEATAWEAEWDAESSQESRQDKIRRNLRIALLRKSAQEIAAKHYLDYRRDILESALPREIYPGHIREGYQVYAVRVRNEFALNNVRNISFVRNFLNSVNSTNGWPLGDREKKIVTMLIELVEGVSEDERQALQSKRERRSWLDCYNKAQGCFLKKEFDQTIALLKEALEGIEEQGDEEDMDSVKSLMLCSLAEAIEAKGEEGHDQEIIGYLETAKRLNQERFGIPNLLSILYTRTNDLERARDNNRLACERLLGKPENAKDSGCIFVLSSVISFNFAVTNDIPFIENLVQTVLTMERDILDEENNFDLPLQKALSRLVESDMDKATLLTLAAVFERIDQLACVQERPAFRIPVLLIYANLYSRFDDAEKIFAITDRAEKVTQDARLSTSERKEFQARLYSVRGLLLKGQGRSKEAEEDFIRTIAIQPGNIDVMVDLVNLYFQTQDYERLIRFVKDRRTILGSHSQNFRIPGFVRVACHDIGAAYMITGRWKDARKYIEETLAHTQEFLRNDVKPGILLHISAMGYRAEICLNEGLFEAGLSFARQALRLQEEKGVDTRRSDYLYFILGRANYELKRYEKIPEILEEARERGYVNAGLLNLTAIAYGDHLQDEEKAARFYREAVDLAPEGLEKAKGLYNLAMKYAEMGQIDKMEEAAKEALAQDPTYPEAHLAMASVYQQRGEVDKAVQSYCQVRSLGSDSINARLNLAVLYAQVDRLDDAANELRPVMATDRYENALLAELPTQPRKSRAVLSGVAIFLVRELSEEIVALTEQIDRKAGKTKENHSDGNGKKTKGKAGKKSTAKAKKKRKDTELETWKRERRQKTDLLKVQMRIFLVLTENIAIEELIKFFETMMEMEPIKADADLADQIRQRVVQIPEWMEDMRKQQEADEKLAEEMEDLLGQAWSFYDQGRYEEAKKYVDQILSKMPLHEGARALRIKILYAHAQKAFKEDRLSDARRFAGAVLGKDPSHEGARALLAQIGQKEKEKALERLQGNVNKLVELYRGGDPEGFKEDLNKLREPELFGDIFEAYPQEAGAIMTVAENEAKKKDHLDEESLVRLLEERTAGCINDYNFRIPETFEECLSALGEEFQGKLDEEKIDEILNRARAEIVGIEEDRLQKVEEYKGRLMGIACDMPEKIEQAIADFTGQHEDHLKEQEKEDIQAEVRECARENLIKKRCDESAAALREDRLSDARQLADEVLALDQDHRGAKNFLNQIAQKEKEKRLDDLREAVCGFANRYPGGDSEGVLEDLEGYRRPGSFGEVFWAYRAEAEAIMVEAKQIAKRKDGLDEAGLAKTLEEEARAAVIDYDFRNPDAFHNRLHDLEEQYAGQIPGGRIDWILKQAEDSVDRKEEARSKKFGAFRYSALTIAEQRPQNFEEEFARLRLQFSEHLTDYEIAKVEKLAQERLKGSLGEIKTSDLKQLRTSVNAIVSSYLGEDPKGLGADFARLPQVHEAIFTQYPEDAEGIVKAARKDAYKKDKVILQKKNDVLIAGYQGENLEELKATINDLIDSFDYVFGQGEIETFKNLTLRSVGRRIMTNLRSGGGIQRQDEDETVAAFATQITFAVSLYNPVDPREYEETRRNAIGTFENKLDSDQMNNVLGQARDQIKKMNDLHNIKVGEYKKQAKALAEEQFENQETFEASLDDFTKGLLGKGEITPQEAEDIKQAGLAEAEIYRDVSSAEAKDALAKERLGIDPEVKEELTFDKVAEILTDQYPWIRAHRFGERMVSEYLLAVQTSDSPMTPQQVLEAFKEFKSAGMLLTEALDGVFGLSIFEKAHYQMRMLLSNAINARNDLDWDDIGALIKALKASGEAINLDAIKRLAGAIKAGKNKNFDKLIEENLNGSVGFGLWPQDLMDMLSSGLTRGDVLIALILVVGLLTLAYALSHRQQIIEFMQDKASLSRLGTFFALILRVSPLLREWDTLQQPAKNVPNLGWPKTLAKNILLLPVTLAMGGPVYPNPYDENRPFYDHAIELKLAIVPSMQKVEYSNLLTITYRKQDKVYSIDSDDFHRIMNGDDPECSAISELTDKSEDGLRPVMDIKACETLASLFFMTRRILEEYPVHSTQQIITFGASSAKDINQERKEEEEGITLTVGLKISDGACTIMLGIVEMVKEHYELHPVRHDIAMIAFDINEPSKSWLHYASPLAQRVLSQDAGAFSCRLYSLVNAFTLFNPSMSFLSIPHSGRVITGHFDDKATSVNEFLFFNSPEECLLLMILLSGTFFALILRVSPQTKDGDTLQQPAKNVPNLGWPKTLAKNILFLPITLLMGGGYFNLAHSRNVENLVSPLGSPEEMQSVFSLPGLGSVHLDLVLWGVILVLAYGVYRNVVMSYVVRSYGLTINTNPHCKTVGRLATRYLLLSTPLIFAVLFFILANEQALAGMLFCDLPAFMLFAAVFPDDDRKEDSVLTENHPITITATDGQEFTLMLERSYKNRYLIEVYYNDLRYGVISFEIKGSEAIIGGEYKSWSEAVRVDTLVLERRTRVRYRGFHAVLVIEAMKVAQNMGAKFIETIDDRKKVGLLRTLCFEEYPLEDGRVRMRFYFSSGRSIPKAKITTTSEADDARIAANQNAQKSQYNAAIGNYGKGTGYMGAARLYLAQRNDEQARKAFESAFIAAKISLRNDNKAIEILDQWKEAMLQVSRTTEAIECLERKANLLKELKRYQKALDPIQEIARIHQGLKAYPEASDYYYQAASLAVKKLKDVDRGINLSKEAYACSRLANDPRRIIFHAWVTIELLGHKIEISSRGQVLRTICDGFDEQQEAAKLYGEAKKHFEAAEETPGHHLVAAALMASHPLIADYEQFIVLAEAANTHYQRAPAITKETSRERIVADIGLLRRVRMNVFFEGKMPKEARCAFELASTLAASLNEPKLIPEFLGKEISRLEKQFAQEQFKIDGDRSSEKARQAASGNDHPLAITHGLEAVSHYIKAQVFGNEVPSMVQFCLEHARTPEDFEKIITKIDEWAGGLLSGFSGYRIFYLFNQPNQKMIFATDQLPGWCRLYAGELLFNAFLWTSGWLHENQDTTGYNDDFTQSMEFLTKAAEYLEYAYSRNQRFPLDYKTRNLQRLTGYIEKGRTRVAQLIEDEKFEEAKTACNAVKFFALALEDGKTAGAIFEKMKAIDARTQEPAKESEHAANQAQSEAQAYERKEEYPQALDKYLEAAQCFYEAKQYSCVQSVLNFAFQIVTGRYVSQEKSYEAIQKIAWLASSLAIHYRNEEDSEKMMLPSLMVMLDAEQAFEKHEGEIGTKLYVDVAKSYYEGPREYFAKIADHQGECLLIASIMASCPLIGENDQFRLLSERAEKFYSGTRDIAKDAYPRFEGYVRLCVKRAEVFIKQRMPEEGWQAYRLATALAKTMRNPSAVPASLRKDLERLDHPDNCIYWSEILRQRYLGENNEKANEVLALGDMEEELIWLAKELRNIIRELRADTYIVNVILWLADMGKIPSDEFDSWKQEVLIVDRVWDQNFSIGFAIEGAIVEHGEDIDGIIQYFRSGEFCFEDDKFSNWVFKLHKDAIYRGIFYNSEVLERMFNECHGLGASEITKKLERAYMRMQDIGKLSLEDIVFMLKAVGKITDEELPKWRAQIGQARVDALKIKETKKQKRLEWEMSLREGGRSGRKKKGGDRAGDPETVVRLIEELVPEGSAQSDKKKKEIKPDGQKRYDERHKPRQGEGTTSSEKKKNKKKQNKRSPGEKKRRAKKKAAKRKSSNCWFVPGLPVGHAGSSDAAIALIAAAVGLLIMIAIAYWLTRKIRLQSPVAHLLFPMLLSAAAGVLIILKVYSASLEPFHPFSIFLMIALTGIVRSDRNTALRQDAKDLRLKLKQAVLERTVDEEMILKAVKLMARYRHWLRGVKKDLRNEAELQIARNMPCLIYECESCLNKSSQSENLSFDGSHNPKGISYKIAKKICDDRERGHFGFDWNRLEDYFLQGRGVWLAIGKTDRRIIIKGHGTILMSPENDLINIREKIMIYLSKNLLVLQNRFLKEQSNQFQYLGCYLQDLILFVYAIDGIIAEDGLALIIKNPFCITSLEFNPSQKCYVSVFPVIDFAHLNHIFWGVAMMVLVALILKARWVDKLRNKEVIIIGAGIGGSYAAMLAARNGFNVRILERTPENKTGDPLFGRKCAEGVWLEKLVQAGFDMDRNHLPDWVVHSTNQFMLGRINKRGQIDTAELRTTPYLYINRKLFEQENLRKAQEAGAIIDYGVNIEDLEAFAREHSDSIILLATGTNASLTRQMLLPEERRKDKTDHSYALVAQYTYTGVDLTRLGKYKTLIASDNPDIGWFYMYPRGRTAESEVNVGIGFAKAKTSRPFDVLDSIIACVDEHFGGIFENAMIIPDRKFAKHISIGKPITFSNMDKERLPNVIPIGDAARQASALTGGGIGNALYSAKEAISLLKKHADKSPAVVQREYFDSIQDFLENLTKIAESYSRLYPQEKKPKIRVLNKIMIALSELERIDGVLSLVSLKELVGKIEHEQTLPEKIINEFRSVEGIFEKSAYEKITILLKIIKERRLLELLPQPELWWEEIVEDALEMDLQELQAVLLKEKESQVAISSRKEDVLRAIGFYGRLSPHRSINESLPEAMRAEGVYDNGKKEDISIGLAGVILRDKPALGEIYGYLGINFSNLDPILFGLALAVLIALILKAYRARAQSADGRTMDPSASPFAYAQGKLRGERWTMDEIPRLPSLIPHLS
ncbi:MAG: hypothetical protein ABIJ41_07835 [Candidatus Omnitrophota bacterium]